MSHKTNAQFAIEFIVLLAFMFLAFVVIVSIISSKVAESEESDRQEIAEDIAALVKNEIELAKSANDGYSRDFRLLPKIEGSSYTIEIIANRELVVNYIDKEHVSFLPEKICGDIFLPVNEIDKEAGIVCINSNLDFTQCQNAADPDIGLCDGVDDELLPGAKCCCFLRYGFCGP